MKAIAARTLDELVKSDPRMLQVYLKARAGYDGHALHHHNFMHIVRDMHRALVIAADEPGVDLAVLIPAVLLHDIGFFDPEFRTLGHDVTGGRLARQWLLEIGGYTEEQIDAICHCVRAHKGKAEVPRSLEAQILYDADVLEKAGVAYLLLGGKVLCEFNESLEHFLRRETVDRAREASKGFFTRKGRELDAGRLERTSRLVAEVQQELSTDRADLLLDEGALWAGAPPR
jgi:HD superfamily phosphodiesterase